MGRLVGRKFLDSRLKVATREQFVIEAARFNRLFSHPGMTGLKTHAARTMMNRKCWGTRLVIRRALTWRNGLPRRRIWRLRRLANFTSREMVGRYAVREVFYTRDQDERILFHLIPPAWYFTQIHTFDESLASTMISQIRLGHWQCLH